LPEKRLKALSTQLEAFYNSVSDGNGQYPAIGATSPTPYTYGPTGSGGSVGNAVSVNLTNDTDVVINLRGIDLNSLRSPTTSNQANNVWLDTSNSTTPATGAASATVAGVGGYLYQPLTSELGGGHRRPAQAVRRRSPSLDRVQTGYALCVVPRD
jgi:hypothetical protein